MSDVRAFPSRNEHDPDFDEDGMTLRDYFAARAMAVAMTLHPQTLATHLDPRYMTTEEEVALLAYRYADMMMHIRAKPALKYELKEATSDR